MNSFGNNGLEYVELHRTFSEISLSDDVEDKDDLLRYLTPENRLTWADLVMEYRVVILSEAGSGKTEEIRQTAHKLRKRGKHAFFLRMEHIRHNFDEALEIGSTDEFADWLNSGEEGWILLDSIDEARLRSPNDFGVAIRTLGSRISMARDRCHIIITGRTSAWRPIQDLRMCTQHLPLASSKDEVEENNGLQDGIHTVQRDDPRSPFKIVALDNLSPRQIEQFLRAKGVNDSADFLEAVEKADAWSFTSRPQDLEELAGYWSRKNRIGTRLEILRNSIDRRLRERDPDRAESHPLSLNSGREGAQRIAAAATLCQESTIRIPDGAINSNGIPICDILPEWNEIQQATLLSRPIFDEAIYGTVRFHHRSVREYLTAEWFAELLDRHSSRRKIEALFFRNQYGHDVVVPALRPILPWLASLNDKFCQSLRSIAPEVFFESGDPSQLPLYTRQSLLDEVCEELAKGPSLRSVTDYEAVQRFAGRDLEGDVCRLLDEYRRNDEITGFLLKMVWVGELHAALPQAKSVALAAQRSRYSRIAAFRAVKAIGSDKDCEDIRKAFLEEGCSLKREWISVLIQGLTPSTRGVQWLLAVLAKSARKKDYEVDYLCDAVCDFVREADLSVMPTLISGLNDLLGVPPFVEKGYCEVSGRFMWLMRPAAQAIERLALEQHPATLDTPTLNILGNFAISKTYGIDERHEPNPKFAEIVPEWPELNRALFWFQIEQARARLGKKSGERLTEYWRASIFDVFWHFDKEDFEYIGSQIQSRQLDDDRAVALSLAFGLYVDNGRPRAWRRQLKALVGSNKELTDQLNTYLKPPAQSKELRRSTRRHSDWVRRNKERARKARVAREEWKKSLANNTEVLRSRNKGMMTNAQHHLLVEMREHDRESNRWTNGGWEVLIEEHGHSVARAFRDGAVAFWRHYIPKLRSEGADPHHTPYAVVFGLVGLSIESRESENWERSLTKGETYIACRYAAWELNGFPTWFPTLFERHTETVRSFLLEEIRYELSKEVQASDTHYILSDISQVGDWAWEELALPISELLQAREPRNLRNLQMMLTIVQGASINDSALEDLAAKKCGSVHRLDHLAIWYSVWVGVAPTRAIPAFAERARRVSRRDDRMAFVSNFAVNLLGNRRQGSRARDVFRQPPHLKSLYLLIHDHVRTEDDIDRLGGGVYSPGLRDDAQEAREYLLSLLEQIPGKEAYLAIMEIAKSHPNESKRPWIALQAKKKAEDDADLDAWKPSQVNDFQDSLERTPSNHRELAELAIMRLLDMKDDIENGDTSMWRLLQNVTQETEMRNYLGHELRRTANRRYTIPQEEELADAKKPDLRFHGTSFDGPVPVELKLADNWTGPKLFERLKNQLCGDYLRDNRSSRGIFVLINRGEKGLWQIPGSKQQADFEELVCALRSFWNEISCDYTGVDDVTVMGIDLTRRVAPSTQAN